MADPFFDTNILIDWLSGVQAAEAELARYPRHRIARPVWTELIALEPEESRDALARLIAPFEVLEIDARIASAAASIEAPSFCCTAVDLPSKKSCASLTRSA